MAEIHRFIVQNGIEEARRQALTKHERQVIEAAYQVLSDDAEKIGFTYSGFALTSLPHRPQAEVTWRREGHNLTMLIQSGVDRQGEPLGLPFGRVIGPRVGRGAVMAALRNEFCHTPAQQRLGPPGRASAQRTPCAIHVQ
jgi:hypothetical protein